MPTGLHGCAITGYATSCYATSAHCDVSDLGYSIGIRARRGEHEPKSAYQFVYPSVRRLGSTSDDHHGVILSQPTGTITLWPAKWLYHGSSVDVREEEETADKSEETAGKSEETVDKSVGLVLVQKSPVLSFCQTSALNKVINLEAIQRYYDRPDSNVTFGPHKRKRKLSQKNRKKRCREQMVDRDT